MAAKRKRSISPAQAQRLLERQRAREEKAKDKAKVESAVKKFRPRKADRGKLVFIGVNGQRDAKQKGRKGFLVYVNTKGRKQPVKEFTGPRKPRAYAKPKRFRNLNLDTARKRKTAFKEFLKANSRTFGTDRAFVKGSVRKTGAERGLKFSKDSRLVKKLSRDITRALRSRKARRVFLVSIMAVVEVNGQRRTVETSAKIERQDFASIDRGGIEQFVLRKIYAFMAGELAGLGLVSAGSARHVQGLKENKGKPRSDWTKGGLPWQGRKLGTANILSMEYRIDEITA